MCCVFVVKSIILSRYETSLPSVYTAAFPTARHRSLFGSTSDRRPIIPFRDTKGLSLFNLTSCIFRHRCEDLHPCSLGHLQVHSQQQPVNLPAHGQRVPANNTNIPSDAHKFAAA